MKPSIPLSPLKSIPSFDETRKNATRNPLKRTAASGGLIDFSPSAPAPVMGGDKLANPFNGPQSVALRTEDEQQAAAREREEQEKQDREKQAILDQRAARRKSLGTHIAAS